MTGLAVFYVLFLLLVVNVYEAFVFTQLWEWFIIPTFYFPSISIAVAYGICLIPSLIRNNIADTVKQDMVHSFEVDATYLFKVTFGLVLNTSFIWGMAAIVKEFI